MSSAAVMDTGKVKADCYTGLTLWARGLPDSEVKALQGRLTTYMSTLLPEVEDLAVRMTGETRKVAVLVVARASVVAVQSLYEPDVAPWYVEDAAEVCRSLLTLRERPGRLVEPWGLDEAVAAGRCRLCRECAQPIRLGERWIAREPGTSSQSGGLLHAGCAPGL